MLAGCATPPSHDQIQAAFDQGLKAYDAGDYKTAYATWHDIEADDLAALRNVALMLRKGQGVEKDPKAALQKMARAADTGLATAQADLGEMLLNGEGTARDPKAAAEWLGRAAASGHPLAAYALAQLYETGDGVDKDLAKARALYQAAADAGYAQAAKRLSALPASTEPAPKPIPGKTEASVPAGTASGTISH
jgi:FOG: TPR repeat, SEL1 subfamily